MDANGKNPRRLSNDGVDDSRPSWSPDNKQIAFTSSRDGQFEVYVMAADGKNQQRLANSPDIRIHNWQPSWSPDGEHIAFTSDWQIHVMDADGGNPRNLTNNRGSHSHPSWLLDGERIVFASKKDDNMESYVMDVDGKNQQKLTDNRHDDVDPAWFDPVFAVEVAPFAVTPTGKRFTMWGRLKQVDR